MHFFVLEVLKPCLDLKKDVDNDTTAAATETADSAFDHFLDKVLQVPVGTQVLDEDREIILHDFSFEGEELVIARGGDGGHGNARYKTSTNRAPRRADEGYAGEERWVWLRLKLIADATARDYELFAFKAEVMEDDLAVLIKHLGPDRHLQHLVIAARASTVAPFAVVTALAFEVLSVAKVDQRVEPVRCFDDHVATAPTITTITARQIRLVRELFPSFHLTYSLDTVSSSFISCTTCSTCPPSSFFLPPSYPLLFLQPLAGVLMFPY